MSTDSENEENTNTIIIDNGSANCKVGLSNYSSPITFANCIGFPKYKQIMGYFNMESYHKNDKNDDITIGDSALKKSAIFKVDYPIVHGVVNNWDIMERIWGYIFTDLLRVAPEEHNIIITEPCLNPRENREKVAQILFETFNIPGLYIANQGIMALNSTGRSTGIVVESGDGVTQIVPVFENYTLPHAIKRLDIGGRDLSEFMSSLLTELNYRYTSSSEKIIINTMKEKACYVAQDYEKEFEHYDSYCYELPDGGRICLREQRFKCPEALFNPKIMHKEGESIVEACFDSIQKCDIDIKPTLYSNIILSGGNTAFKGLGQRFLSDMKKLIIEYVNKQNENKNYNASEIGILMDVKVKETENKKCEVWEGAKIFSEGYYMQSNWITKTEYEESGATIVHRKCF